MRLLAPVTLIALLCLAPSALAAEKLSADRTCYIAGKHQTVNMTGSGFAANAAYTAYSGDQAGPEEGDDLNLVHHGVTGADGSLAFSFPVFKLEHGGRYNPDITVTLDDDSLSGYAQEKIRMTSNVAGFYMFQTSRTRGWDSFGVFSKTGTSGSGILGQKVARGLKKAHYEDDVQMFGMGYGDGSLPQGKWLWAHYLKGKKHVRDVYVAQARACGSASSLSGRDLFPGKKPAPGKYRIQFDWNKRYSPNTSGAHSIHMKVLKSGWVTFPNSANVVYDYDE